MSILLKLSFQGQNRRGKISESSCFEDIIAYAANLFNLQGAELYHDSTLLNENNYKRVLSSQGIIKLRVEEVDEVISSESESDSVDQKPAMSFDEDKFLDKLEKRLIPVLLGHMEELFESKFKQMKQEMKMEIRSQAQQTEKSETKDPSRRKRGSHHSRQGSIYARTAKRLQMPTPASLRCTFEKDLSYDDGQQVNCGETIRKSWQVSNTSSFDWPSGCDMTIQGNSKIQVVEYQVPTLKAGESGNVTAVVKMPSEPGRVFQVFRLKQGSFCFGDQLWLDVVAMKLPEITSQELVGVVEEVTDSSEYESEVEIMNDQTESNHNDESESAPAPSTSASVPVSDEDEHMNFSTLTVSTSNSLMHSIPPQSLTASVLHADDEDLLDVEVASVDDFVLVTKSNSNSNSQYESHQEPNSEPRQSFDLIDLNSIVENSTEESVHHSTVAVTQSLLEAMRPSSGNGSDLYDGDVEADQDPVEEDNPSNNQNSETEDNLVDDTEPSATPDDSDADEENNPVQETVADDQVSNEYVNQDIHEIALEHKEPEAEPEHETSTPQLEDSVIARFNESQKQSTSFASQLLQQQASYQFQPSTWNPSSQSLSSSSSLSSSNATGPYAQSQDILVKMGFLDIAKNNHLLEKHHGDVNSVVSELLQ